MKNNQEGFVGILVIAIVALLVIGAGTYVYVNKAKPSSSIETKTSANVAATTTTTTTNGGEISRQLLLIPPRRMLSN